MEHSTGWISNPNQFAMLYKVANEMLGTPGDRWGVQSGDHDEFGLIWRFYFEQAEDHAWFIMVLG